MEASVPIDSYFATQIYYDSLTPKKTKQFTSELAKECLKIREVDEAGQLWSVANYGHGYTSYATMNALHEFSTNFSDLEKKIRIHVKKFTKSLDMDLGGGELVMVDSWLNIMPAFQAHGLHLHPLSIISGTYYVQVPKGSGGIKFEDPRLASYMAAPPKVDNPKKHNQQFVTYTPEVAKLVLFESWLRHEVPASPVDGERISVSFNYSWG